MVHSVHYSNKSDEWYTPPTLFAALDYRYNFTLDPCAAPGNFLGTPAYYTETDDGLSRSWKNHTVFCNPPYSQLSLWLCKGYEERVPAVYLIPARTDTRAFHEIIFPYAAWIFFIQSRLKFSNAENPAPFPSCLVGFQIEKFDREELRLFSSVRGVFAR